MKFRGLHPRNLAKLNESNTINSCDGRKSEGRSEKGDINPCSYL